MAGKIASPLRYPGGKSKLYNTILNIFKYNNINTPIYVEPFAGGCSLALNLLFNKKVKSIIINDFDYAIYSIWFCILNNHDEFINLIKETEINLKEWHRQKEIYLNRENYSQLQLAFSTLFLNRTNRSGIITAGPIGGKKQDGNYKIDCRFNKKDIINKINKIYQYRNKIRLYHLDAEDLIKKISKSTNINNMFIYLDPPYFEKGPCLYKNSFDLLKHESLHKSIKKYLKNKNWIVTYDNTNESKKMYNDYNQIEFTLNYSAGNNKTGKEIMIFSNSLISKI